MSQDSLLRAKIHADNLWRLVGNLGAVLGFLSFVHNFLFPILGGVTDACRRRHNLQQNNLLENPVQEEVNLSVVRE